MQKITPFLWFNDNAEEAVNFYVSVFPDAKAGSFTRYDEESSKAAGRPVGSVMTGSFQLFGQDFTAINGGPVFRFTEAVSFVVNCETQEEIDRYWEKLTADGGQESQCGWLKDKFGLSWQIVPSILGQLMQDPERAKKVMHVVMQMKKLDLAEMKRAAGQD